MAGHFLAALFTDPGFALRAHIYSGSIFMVRARLNGCFHPVLLELSMP
jgi:hypothetical protein